jgi:proteasome lid subunit RPN8/RPN11
MRASDLESRNGEDERPAPRAEEGGAHGLVPERVLREIVRHAEGGYPEEVCGMVIGRPGSPETYRVRPVANVANREPQEDPGGRLRDARTAYKMDPLEQLRVLREADAEGWDAVLFYHSHPDHEAYFSAMDRARALAPDGVPLWPGATYLVVSVFDGQARAASQHAWDAQRRDFDEYRVRLPSADGPFGAHDLICRETMPERERRWSPCSHGDHFSIHGGRGE